MRGRYDPPSQLVIAHLELLSASSALHPFAPATLFRVIGFSGASSGFLLGLCGTCCGGGEHGEGELGPITREDQGASEISFSDLSLPQMFVLCVCGRNVLCRTLWDASTDNLVSLSLFQLEILLLSLCWLSS